MSNKKIKEKLNQQVIPNELQWVVDELIILMEANERLQDERGIGVRIIHSSECSFK